jgi:hypothetical protein
MEYKGLLLLLSSSSCSQEHANESYPEADNYTPHRHILFLYH